MGASRLADLGNLIRRLNSDSRLSDPDSFRDMALKALQERAWFGRAIWGDAAIADRMTLQAPEMFNFAPDALADAEAGAFADPRLMQVLANPGTAHAYSLGDADPAALVSLAQRHDIGHIMSIAVFDSETGIASGLVLVRSRGDTPFSEEDRAFVEAAFSHLMAAWTDCQITSLLRETRLRLGLPHHAAALRSLYLTAAGTDFVALLRSEWPQWAGPRVPDALIDSETGNVRAHYVGIHIVARSYPSADIALLTLRARVAADDLTTREREVAELCATGQTYREIAEALNLAPSTARNHVQRVHRRLGVARNSEIGAMLAELQ